MNITVPVAVLREALTATKAAASTDDMLPPLNAVQFEVAGGELILAATDRYTLIVASTPADGARATEDGTALLPLDAVKVLLSYLKETAAQKRATRTVTLNVDAATHCLALAFSDSPGIAIPFPLLVDSAFPKYRSLLEGFTKDGAVDFRMDHGLNALYLARFAPFGRHGAIRLVPHDEAPKRSGARPMKVVGMTPPNNLPIAYVGLIMPVRGES